MKRNIELLTQIRDLIVKDPAKLNMGTWATVADVIDFGGGKTAKVSCGTTACIAGWAVQMAGDKLLVSAYATDLDNDDNLIYDVSACVAKNGHVDNIEDRARKLLGLTDREAGVVFMADDESALSYLEKLIAGEDIVGEYYDDDEEF